MPGFSTSSFSAPLSGISSLVILGSESCVPEKPQLETGNQLTHHLPSGRLFRKRTCITMMNSAQCFQKTFLSAPVPGEEAGCWFLSLQTYMPYCHWCKCLSFRESHLPFCTKIPTDLQWELLFSLGKLQDHSSELHKAYFTGASFWSGTPFCAFKI